MKQLATMSNKAKNTKTTSEWLTIKEAQTRLKISRATLRRLTKGGKLIAYTIGTSIRYAAEDVDALVTPLIEDGSKTEAKTTAA